MMKWELTVITTQGRRHVEEIDAATFAGPIPLPTTTIAVTSAGMTYSNPITLPSGVIGDVYDIKPLHYHLTHLADDKPAVRIYP